MDWAKLGEGTKGGKLPDRSDTLHGVGDESDKVNDPPGLPFIDAGPVFRHPKAQPGRMFDAGDVVVHVHSGFFYDILSTPGFADGAGYSYREVGRATAIRNRSQAEMEDGRFAIHRKAISKR